ncbi:MAG: HEAT repeat domain-containing protein [Aureliella sp.]
MIPRRPFTQAALPAVICIFLQCSPSYAQDSSSWKTWQEQLSSPTVVARARAASALGRLGEGAVEAAPQLIEALSDPDASVRLNAATALGYVLGEPQAAVDGLVTLLSDSDEHTRYAAEWALARYALLPVPLSKAEARLETYLKAAEELDRRSHHARHRFIIAEAIKELINLLDAHRKPVEVTAKTQATEEIPSKIEESDPEPMPEPSLTAAPEIALPTNVLERAEIEPVSIDVGMIAELRSLVDEYRLGNRLDRLWIIQSLSQQFETDLQPTVKQVRFEVLQTALEQSDPLCIQYALQSWGSFGQATIRALFAKYIHDEDPPNWMVQVIYEHSPENDKELNSLFQVASDPSRGTAVRMAALTTLSTRGIATESTINFLCRFALSPREDEFLRLEALRGLRAAKAGTTPANQVEANLLALLNNTNESWEIRLETAHTLAAVSPLSNQYVHTLCQSALLSNLSDLQRAKLLDVIADCNSPAAKDLILLSLRSKDELTQVASLRAVGRIGPLAGDLVSDLVAFFQNDSNSQFVLDECAQALASVGAPAIEELNRALATLPPSQQIRGLNALASTGHHACMAMEYCLTLLQDLSVDARVQCAAVNAIGRMGPGASSAREALLQYLDRAPIPAGKAAAIIALTETGSLPIESIEAIQPTNEHPAIKSAVAFARYIDGDFGGAETLVQNLLSGDDTYAGQALRDIGSGAIAPLARLANDRSASAGQRVLAMEMLSQMPQAAPSYLLPSIADEQLGRVSQECLTTANYQDGGIQVVCDILERLQNESDPQVAYRMERVIEELPYSAPIPARPISNELGTRLATRLQQDHVSLVAYNAPATDFAELPIADNGPNPPNKPELPDLPIYTSLDVTVPLQEAEAKQTDSTLNLNEASSLPSDTANDPQTPHNAQTPPQTPPKARQYSPYRRSPKSLLRNRWTSSHSRHRRSIPC